MPIKPNEIVPELRVPLVGGGEFDLADRKPAAFTMVVFYRGYHCPICRSFLHDLQRHVAEFAHLGVDAIAVSADDRERAEKTKREWALDHLTLGYGFSLDLAREWGLYISRAISDQEPPWFIEPGLFLVRPDRTLYAASIQSLPFARLSFNEVENAVRFIRSRNYPARGAA